MMQTIKCRQCNKSHIVFSKVSITVVFSKTTRGCEHCNNTNTSTISVFFCSPKCVEEFLKNNKFQDMLLVDI